MLLLNGRLYNLPGCTAQIVVTCDHYGLICFRLEAGEIGISNARLVDFLSECSLVKRRGLKKNQLRVVRKEGTKRQQIFDGSAYARKGALVARHRHDRHYTLPNQVARVTVIDCDWAGLVKVRVEAGSPSNVELPRFLARQLRRTAAGLKIVEATTGQVLHKGDAYRRQKRPVAA